MRISIFLVLRAGYVQDNTGIQEMSQKSASKGADSKIVMEENVIHVEHGISGDRAGSKGVVKPWQKKEFKSFEVERNREKAE